MHYRKFLILRSLRIAATLFVSAMLMAALALSARASTFQMVDAQTNSGDMVLNYFGGASYNAGQWTIPLQASNTGSQTYNDVNLVEQFVWDNSNGTNELPLAWSTANQNWTNSVPETFAMSNATGGTLTPFLLSDANTPLTWSKTGNPETVLSTDVVPAIALGNFGPGATQNFTLTCPASPGFPPDVVGFFVAVPEPLTVALLAVGGVALLGYRWRRRRAA